MTPSGSPELSRLQACDVFFLGWARRLRRAVADVPAAPAKAAQSVRILIVDDEEAVRTGIRKTLQQAGFHFLSEAADCASALGALAAGPVDLVICACDMLEGRGLGLVRAQNASPRTGFILLTGAADRKLAAKAVRCGVHHFLVKPFTARRLRQKIQDVVGVLA